MLGCSSPSAAPGLSALPEHSPRCSGVPRKILEWPGHLLLPLWSRASVWLSFWSTAQCCKDSNPPDLGFTLTSLRELSQPTYPRPVMTSTQQLKTPTLEPDSLSSNFCFIPYQHGDLRQLLGHPQPWFPHMSNGDGNSTYSSYNKEEKRYL